MLYLIPVALQGFLILFDEIYFHRKRDLSQWERIGHPLDTLSFLVCCLWAYFSDNSAFALNVYLGLSLFSCVLVTKDEFVHAKHCTGAESWLHAVLFLLHPIVLYIFWHWKTSAQHSLLLAQALLICTVLTVQIIYWNFPRITLSTIKHLRFGFSFFMLPIALFALSEMRDFNIFKALILFAIFSFSIFPASNGYNSHYDQDTTSIGGLEKPPQTSSDLLFYSNFVELIGLITTAFLFGPLCFALLTLYGVFSKLYSHPRVRLKKYPWISWLVVATFQGAVIYFVTHKALNPHFAYSNHILLGTLIGFLMIAASYPITQIYQHSEDQKRGDETLSLKLGHTKTMIFSSGLMLVTGILMVLHLGFNYKSAIFVLFLLGPAIFHRAWTKKIKQDPAEANFNNTHKFLKLSGFAMNAVFIVMIFMSQFALAATNIQPDVFGKAETFTMKRMWTSDDFKVIFTSTNNELLSEEIITVDDKFKFKKFIWNYKQKNEMYEIINEDNQILFSHKGETNTLKLDQEEAKELVLPAQLQDFIIVNWDRLQKENIKFSLVVPDLEKVFYFTIKLKEKNDDRFIYELNANSMFVRLAVKTVTFIFDHKKNLKEIKNAKPPVVNKATNIVFE